MLSGRLPPARRRIPTRRALSLLLLLVTIYWTVWLALSAKLFERGNSLPLPTSSRDQREILAPAALLQTACAKRWTDEDQERLAAEVAAIVGPNSVLAVLRSGQATTAKQVAKLSVLLRRAGGGRVVFVVDNDEHIPADFVDSGITVISTNRTGFDSRNLLLDALDGAPVASVLLAETPLWCAGDALRILSRLDNADLVCAGRREEKRPRRPPAFLAREYTSSRRVDNRFEAACAETIRAPATHYSPRDTWTGDLCPTRVAFGGVSRVFTCWSELVAVRSSHLFGRDPPPLRFRPSVPALGECAAHPSLNFVLDVHRRVQKSGLGLKANVLLDSSARADALSFADNQQQYHRRVSVASPRDEPGWMPKLWRCCVSGTCSWYPTHLDHVEGDYTAAALASRGRHLLQQQQHTPLSMLEVPRSVKRTREANSTAKIPRRIWQTFKSRRMPRSLAMNCMKWIEMNPDFDYELMDDDDVAAYVKEHYGPREIQALAAAPSGAHRADLFRYLVVLREGGVYVDVDAECKQPLSSWLYFDDDTLVASLNGPPRFDMTQWAFAAPSNHPVLGEAAALAVDNLLRFEQRADKREVPDDVLRSVAKSRGLRRILTHADGFLAETRFDCPRISDMGDNLEALTGPPVLQAALEKLLARRLSKSSAILLSKESRIEAASNLTALLSLRPPLFGGAIQPKYVDENLYRSNLKLAGVEHWSLALRRKRSIHSSASTPMAIPS